jgi:uncharacterized membrane protein YqjE
MKKTAYNSIYDIRIAKEKLRYEVKLHEEKLRNANYLLMSGISMSLNNLRLNVKNRLVSFALFRSLYRSKYAIDFVRNFIRGFRRTG